MRVFGHVSAELTEEVVSLLPYDSVDGVVTGSCTVNERRALYLRSQLSDHDVIICSQLDALKLSGTWETLLAVHCWLQKWCDNVREGHANSICLSTNSENSVTKSHEMQQILKPKHATRSTAKMRYTANEGSRKSTCTVNVDKKAFLGRKTGYDEYDQKKRIQHASPLMDEVPDIPKPSTSAVANFIAEFENDQCAGNSNDFTEQDSLLHKLPESQPVATDADSDNSVSVVREKESLKEFKCDSCDYVASIERNLSYHKLRVHGIKTHKCSVCRSSYALLKDLRQHLKVHSENYCCEHCGQKLKSRYALMLHIGRIHNNTAPRPVKHYLCTLCGKLCRSKTDFTAHRNKQHLGIRPFRCDVCGAEFYARANLRAHEPIHSEKRLFKCKHCDKSFKQRQGLRIHIAGVHTTVRPYQCQQCTKSFTQRTTLDRHVLTHTRTRPFACTHCSSMFNDCSVLRRHLVGVHKLTEPAEIRRMIKDSRARARMSESLGGVNKVVPVLASDKNVATFDTTQINNETTVQPTVGEIITLHTDTVGSTALSGEVVNFSLNDMSAVFGSPTVSYSNILLGLLTKPNDSVDLMQLVDPLYVLPADCSVGAGGLIGQTNLPTVGVVSSTSSCGELTDTDACTLSQFMLGNSDSWKAINDN